MLQSANGDSGVVGKLTSILKRSNVTKTAHDFHTSDEARVPLLADNSDSQNTSPTARPLRPRYLANRSISDQTLLWKIGSKCANEHTTPYAVHLQHHDGLFSPIESRLRLSMPVSRTNSTTDIQRDQIRSGSTYYDPADVASTLHRKLTQQRNSACCSISTSAQYDSDTGSPALKTPASGQTFHKLHGRHRIGSHESPIISGKIPLKSCFKNKAKSTTVTPPAEQENAKDGFDEGMLRRVKTVDFDVDRTKEMLRLPSLVDLSTEHSAELHASTLPLRRSETAFSLVKSDISWPTVIRTTKSGPADPATTRTDVHVIARAPSWNFEVMADPECVGPTTPTMQIVESKNGSYEVIWDDILPEHSVKLLERRDSAASHALGSICSTSPRGLERVNTKLSDWSGRRDSSLATFKPTAVVLPDDGGSGPIYDCTVYDNEDLTVLAPSSSQITTRTPSPVPSPVKCAPVSRMGSLEDLRLDETSQIGPTMELAWSSSSDSLAVPISEAQSSQSNVSRRKCQQPWSGRKLSNMDEADLRFRGHRDSVTIAHSRLIRSGHISPELFARKDSVVMARKRMHARNHAATGARDVHMKHARLHHVRGVTTDDCSKSRLSVVEGSPA